MAGVWSNICIALAPLCQRRLVHSSCRADHVTPPLTPPPPPPARALSLYLFHSQTHTHTATSRAFPTSDGQYGDPTPRLLPPLLRAIPRHAGVTPAMKTCSVWKPMQTPAGGNVDSRVWHAVVLTIPNAHYSGRHAGMLTIPAAGTPEGSAFRPSLRGQPFWRSLPASACFIQRCC
jgi:hypothetical protein